MSTEKTLTANGILMSYQDSEKSGIPIIFIHGFPFNRSTWQGQFDFLKETHRVIIYDIRGFGNSESGEKEASIELYADDLIKFMDTLKIDKAIICGLSMGGYILLNALERYRERFKAVILSDTQCIADTPEGKEKRYDTIKEIEKNGHEGFAENFTKKLFSKETQNTKKHLFEKITSIITANKPETVISALKALAMRTETCSRLKDIDVPCLIVCGEEDELTPKAQSEFLLTKISNSKLVLLPNAGHLSNLEKGADFNKAISDFIEKL